VKTPKRRPVDLTDIYRVVLAKMMVKNESFVAEMCGVMLWQAK